MSYVDADYYTNDFGGDVLPSDPEGLINKLLSRAQDKIDEAAMYRIQDLDKWPEFTQKKVRQAVCFQAEHDYAYGDLSSLLGVAGSYSIGDVSISASKDLGGSAEVNHYGICQSAIDQLKPTGLLNRRV